MTANQTKINIGEAITFQLASHIRFLSQTKWNKLMFLLDAVGFCKTDRTFSGYRYIKLLYGPVPDNYRSKIKAMIDKKIVSPTKYNGYTDSVMQIEVLEERKDHNKKESAKAISAFPSSDILSATIEKIIDIFREWTAVRLSDFTHELLAWKIPEMQGEIDLSLLKKDPFLQKNFGEANWGDLILPP